MPLFAVPLAYLGWHYTLALRDLIGLARNFLAFVAHFFSLTILVKTFFSPWRRLDENYQKGFNPGAWLQTFILNTLMRLFGVFCRFWLILVGGLIWLVTFGLAILAFLVWLILPAAIIVLIFTGFNLLLR